LIHFSVVTVHFLLAIADFLEQMQIVLVCVVVIVVAVALVGGHNTLLNGKGYEKDEPVSVQCRGVDGNWGEPPVCVQVGVAQQNSSLSSTSER
jgi:hypothetical protein